jgi:hypothetical protein
MAIMELLDYCSTDYPGVCQVAIDENLLAEKQTCNAALTVSDAQCRALRVQDLVSHSDAPTSTPFWIYAVGSAALVAIGAGFGFWLGYSQ